MKRKLLLSLSLILLMWFQTQAQAVNAVFTSTAITVNGQLNESSWTINNAVSETVEGSPNNTTNFGVLWNNNYLFIGAKVIDANLFNDSGDESPWDDDAIEIFIDGNNNNGSYDASDRQIIKVQNGVIWSQNGNTTGIIHASSVISGGYSIEVAIPWTYLGLSPTNNMTIGFDIAADDDDNGSARESQSVWAGDGDNWQSTTNFGSLTLTGADTQAPSVPTNLSSSNITTTSFTLSWTASTDNVAVTGYDIYQGSTLKGSSATTSFNVTGLTCNTTNSYTVRAKDAAGNQSAASAALNVTTSSCPPPPGSVNADFTSTAITVNGQLNESSWTINNAVSETVEGSPNNTTNFGVLWNNNYLFIGAKVIDANLFNDSGDESPWDDDAIEIFIDGNNNNGSYDASDRQIIKVQNGVIWSQNGNTTGIIHASSVISGGYSIEVAIPWTYLGLSPTNNMTIGFDIAADDDDNGSARESQSVWAGDGNNWQSTTNFGSLTLTGADTQAPSVPTNLSSSNITTTSFTLSWTASTDNVAVTGYDIYQGSTLKGSSATTSFNVTGLTCNTTNSYTVRAKDAAGNQSAASTALNVTTSSCPPPPGSVNADFTSATITIDGQLNESSWTINNAVTKVIEGTPDNTVQFGVNWNNTYLFIGATVMDGNLFNDSGDETPWDDDAIEIFIDGNNNKGTSYDGFDRQIISVNGGTFWINTGVATGILHATSAISGGYSVEMAIPWSNLGISVSNNTQIGFDIGNDDDDNGGARDHQLVWYGTDQNWTNTSAFGTLTLVGAPNDTQAPTAPANLTASNITQTSCTLTWTASTDNFGVTGYDIFDGSTLKGSTTSTTFNVTGLTCNTSHSFTVKAKDLAGNSSAASNSAAVTTSNCTSGTMTIGVNLWNKGWGNGPTDYFLSGVDWSTAVPGTTNVWNPDFLSDLAPFSCIRFMDWGETNGSVVSNWSQRVQPNADQYTSDGVAIEWMIDLCNRTNKNMWICVPHMAVSDNQPDNNQYSTNLATLIRDNLNPGLKVYIEYSNETWNGGFEQAQYVNDHGNDNGLPGSNEYYKGGAFSIWQSLKIFKAFRDVFQGQMADRVVRVCSYSGNEDIFRQGYNNVAYSSYWNPSGEAADYIAVAPYVGNGLDGASGSIQTEFHNAINSVRDNYIENAISISNQFGIPLICYEGGQHLLNNAGTWSSNPDIYTEYRYMLDQWAPVFKMFNQYTLYSNFTSGGAWGAKEYAGQSLSGAHKYRAIVDWLAASGENLAASENLGLPHIVTMYDTIEKESPLRIFPNPTSNMVKIKFANNYRGPVKIGVINTAGAIIKSFNQAKSSQLFEVEVNISDLKSGLYLVKFWTDKMYVVKLLKQ